ncbi:sigma-54 dependent transcriptional regulator PrdR [Thermotalea metallivorans]|uniref:Arginine utilization regulatory protein RocR n=1 Tax=Thermotalea metallivorans TaxID=520762 RepID=A0A140L5J3_9FIRM|nr:sigma-54 dependent transcriptional regulator PrdR [Thermotalea metallivorans]KXG75818.1 Arginine utilization regulatory protein RocR [Thermotalea metallivorans]
MLENKMLYHRVHEILSANIVKARPTAKVWEVMEAILKENISEALIEDENEKLVGMITLTDISAIMKAGHDLSAPVSNFIQTDIITVSGNELISEARKMMIENKIGRLPVCDGDRIIGIIRSDNIRDSYYMKLEAINRQYQHIIDNMHEGVTVTDAAGYVIFWNKSAEKIYDIKAKDILYKRLVDFFPTALTLSVLENRTAIENVYHSPKPNYYIIISALPIFIDGEFMGVVATERDVTEYRNLSVSLEKANYQINLLKEEMEKITTGGFSLGNIIGKSPIIQEKIQLAKHVSHTDTSVLITGESGTGKEVFARSIHYHSKRQGHFVPVNCSAIPHTLFESEFFGYVGGAFTGALKKGKLGYFELANNGTIFLDEIGDLPLDLQAKLLRVLQEGKVLRIGAEKPIPIDVRVISATNKNLKAMVKKGEFREDLYYRLNVVEIELPPLRDRKEDIILLFDHFLQEICQKNQIKIHHIDREVFDILYQYDWKGNIRELRNTVECMVVLSYDNKITVESIPQYIMEGAASTINLKRKPSSLDEALRASEIDMIRKAMSEAKGNKAKAAQLLNIPRSTLYYKLNQYGL